MHGLLSICDFEVGHRAPGEQTRPVQGDKAVTLCMLPKSTAC